MNAFLDELLAAYPQVFFASGRVSGALVAAATFTAPRVGVTGLGGVVVASAVARALHLDAAKRARGVYGYNALLAGLAVGAFVGPSSSLAATAGLVGLVATVAVVAHAALESTLGALLQLPALTLPFVAATSLLVSVAPLCVGVQMGPAAALPGELLPLRSLGAMFFAPTPAAGVLVLLALATWSRIGAVLALVGVAVALAMMRVAPSAPALSLGYNAAAAAIGVGAVWFVPGRASILLGAVAALLASACAVAVAAALAPLGLPSLVLPFNGVALLLLAAMRQRTRDGAPKVVDFLPGTPEANLAFHRGRLARFGARRGVRFRLPFYGRWTVTQGVDGEFTHQGEWRHALDFEVMGDDGRPHAGSGAALTDYHSYRLPVFAAAAGTVVAVRGDVPDNPPGERNPREPFGNVVVLQHAPALCSLVAHLAPGSVEVTVGQVVAAGARLGLCGNSGRSFGPHLHFQLQATPIVGAPTVELELADVVRDGGASDGGDGDGGEGEAALARVSVPARGEVVRNPEPRDDVAALFAFPVGARWRFGRDTVTVGIDLFNQSCLVDGDGGRLVFERREAELVAHELHGARDGVLAWLRAALPSVPFEPGLTWDDELPARAFRGRLAGWLLDLVEPLWAVPGLAMRYRSRRDGAALVVEGYGRRGRRWLATRARVVAGRGVTELELRDASGVRRARQTSDVEVSDADRAPAGAAAARLAVAAGAR